MSLLTTKGTGWTPGGQLGVSVTPSATPWANSGWGVLSSAASVDGVLTGLALSAAGTDTNIAYELDMGIGSAGNEVVFFTYKGMTSTIAGTNYIPLPVPIPISNGARYTVRIRKSGTSISGWRFALGFVQDYDGTPTTGSADGSAGRYYATQQGVSITPNGSAWGSSSYAELIANTDNDIYVTHLAFVPAAAVEFEFDLATGGAGSETIVTVLPGAIESLAGHMVYTLPVPLKIATGNRVAIRLRKAGTSITAWTEVGLTYVKAPNTFPTIALNSPADAGSTADTTPDLVFTGTDTDGDAIEYQVQVDTVNTFDSIGSTATIFSDTFSDSNKNLNLHTPNTGTSWTELWATTAGVGWNIDTNQAAQDNPGSAGGAVYTADATYSVADYYIQCTMVGLDASTDQGIYLMVRVQDIENMYAVYLVDQNGTNTCRLYKKVSGTWTAVGAAFNPPANGSVIKLEIIGTTLTFYDDGVSVASATVSDISAAGKAGIGGGGGTELVAPGDELSTGNILDTLTVVNAVPVTPLIDKVSATDAGFIDITDGTDTHPFDSGDQISYTVQSALAEDTYYWRVRGKDPSGTNTYGAWSTTRSFEVTGAQVIDLPQITSTSTLYTPTVAPGAATLILPLIASISTLYAPTLSPGDVALTLPFIDSAGTLYTPTLEQNLTLPFLTNSNALYEPAIAAGAVDVNLPFIDSTITIYAPSVVYEITLPAIASASTLYAPALTPGDVGLTLPFVASTTILYPLTVVPGAVDLVLPHIASTTQLYSPTLAAGDISLELPFLDSASVLYGMMLSPDLELILPAIPSSATLYAPTVEPGATTIALPYIAASGAIYPPEIAYGVDLPAIASVSALYEPVITPGDVTLEIPFITSSTILHAPTLVSDQSITLPFLASTSALYAPEVTPAAIALALPFIATISSLYTPSATVGAVTITLPVISSGSSLYAPAVTPGAVEVYLPTIGSSALIYSPAVTPGAITVSLPHIASTTVIYPLAVEITGQMVNLPFIATTSTTYAMLVANPSVTAPTIKITAIVNPVIEVNAMVKPAQSVEARLNTPLEIDAPLTSTQHIDAAVQTAVEVNG